MDIQLKRIEYGTNYTIGRLYINDSFFCFTIEDKTRDAGVKVAGETSIPYGTYQVVMDMSTRFGKMMPHVLNVTGFEGIRIHSGNTDKDTEGCILLGDSWPGGDFIGNSKAALARFIPELEKGLLEGPVILQIV
jgi:hypothetical protein